MTGIPPTRTRSLAAAVALVSAAAVLALIATPTTAVAAGSWVATQSGDWDDPTTWSGSVPPTDLSEASLVIPSGVDVTLTSMDPIEITAGNIKVLGRLIVQSDVTITRVDISRASTFDIQGRIEVRSGAHLTFDEEMRSFRIDGRLHNEGWLTVNAQAHIGHFENHGVVDQNEGDANVEFLLSTGTYALLGGWLDVEQGVNSGLLANSGGPVHVLGSFANVLSGSISGTKLVVGADGELRNDAVVDAEVIVHGDVRNTGRLGDFVRVEGGVLENHGSGRIDVTDLGLLLASGWLINRTDGVVDIGSFWKDIDGRLYNDGIMRFHRNPKYAQGTSSLYVGCSGDFEFVDPAESWLVVWDTGQRRVEDPTHDWCDTTPPIVEPRLSGEEGDDGWWRIGYVSFLIRDRDSGILPTEPTCPSGPIPESAGTTYFCTAESAGGVTTRSITVRLDATPPIASAQVGSVANAVGWHAAPVPVSFTGVDALSGIDSCSDPVQVGEGVGHEVSGTCTDVAGNVSEPVVVRGLNVDLTAPSIAFQGVETYLLSDLVDVTCAIADALSGIDEATCNGASGLGLDFDHAAPNPVSASASDLAGNSSHVESSFSINVTLDGIEFAIGQWATTAKASSSLLSSLDKLSKAGDKDTGKKKDKGKATDKLADFDHDVDEAVLLGWLSEADGDHLIALAAFLYGDAMTAPAMT